MKAKVNNLLKVKKLVGKLVEIKAYFIQLKQFVIMIQEVSFYLDGHMFIIFTLLFFQ